MKKRMLVLGEKWRFTRERMVVLPRKKYYEENNLDWNRFQRQEWWFHYKKRDFTLRMKHGGLTEKNVEFHMIA